MDISALFIEKSKDVLPIDIEAHKAAYKEHKNDSIPTARINHLQRILSVEKDNREVMLALGTEYIACGMYQKAETILSRLNDDYGSLPPDSIAPIIMARLGLALFYTNNVSKSIDQLDRCIKRYPRCAEAYCYRGQVEASLESTSGNASRLLEKALDVDSGFTEAYYQLARYHMNKPHASAADFVQARKYLSRQIELDPLNAKAHARLGMIYYYLDHPDMAEKSYKTALLLNNNDFNTHFNLGELYSTILENDGSALEEFEKTVAIKPDHAEALFRIGLYYLERDKHREAIHYLEQARVYAPHNIRILLQLGVAYERSGDMQQAHSAYKGVLSLDELNDIALHKLRLLSLKD